MRNAFAPLAPSALRALTLKPDVPAAQPLATAHPSCIANTATLSAVGFAEVGLSFAVALGAMQLTYALAAHVALIASLMLVGWREHRDGRTHDPVTLLFLVATAALGVAGSLGTLLAALLLRCRAARATGLEAWYAALFPDAESNPGGALYQRLLSGESSLHERCTVAPFADVMASGDIDRKQVVITLIATQFDPGFTPALRGALNDDEPAVRVQAATAVARIESRFLDRSMSLEERWARAPNCAHIALQLARHYDEHATTGLLDAGRVEVARLRALDLYRDSERLGGGGPEVAKAIVRLLVRLGREREAVDTFAPLVNSGAPSPELLAWYVECLFRIGRFTELRQTCLRFDTASSAAVGVSEAYRQAVLLWVGDGQTR